MSLFCRQSSTTCVLYCVRYWNFEFIVSERVQVNPDNSRAMSALTFLLIIQIEYTATKNRQTLSQPKS